MEDQVVIYLEYLDLEEMMMLNNDKRGYRSVYPLLRVICGVKYGICGKKYGVHRGVSK